ncbi:MAG: VOC family protein [Holophagales bacterium]|nr:VOC family protein [Holophagales bacterium]
MTRPIPEGFHTVTPYLIVDGAEAAIDFYARAFGAELKDRHLTPDGKVMYASLRIGDSHIMLNDAFPEYGSRDPKGIGGTAVTIHLFVEDADTVFAKAEAAGAEVLFPIQEMFWGDRFGKVKDPFGHEWSIATRVKDLSSEEIEAAGAAAFG